MKPSPQYADKTVLITGGLGFLGSVLARALVGSGARVRVLDSLAPEGSGSPRNLADLGTTVGVIVDDIRNRDAVQRSIKGCDVVFHLAAVGTPGSQPVDWITDLDVSCLGTLHVLETVRVLAPTARVVFASSSHVYGTPEKLPVAEGAPLRPASLFGAHKLAGENYLSVYRQLHGLDSVVARLADIFGPGQRMDAAAQGTILHAIDALTRGETPAFIDGKTPYDVLFVDDAAALLAALGALPGAGGRTLNVASGVGVTGADIAAALGVKVTIGGPEKRGFIADVTALRSLGLTPATTPLPAALHRTAAWFGHDVL